MNTVHQHLYESTILNPYKVTFRCIRSNPWGCSNLVSNSLMLQNMAYGLGESLLSQMTLLVSLCNLSFFLIHNIVEARDVKLKYSILSL